MCGLGSSPSKRETPCGVSRVDLFATMRAAKRETCRVGEQLRVLAIETEIADELIAEGFNGVFVVEPA